MTRDRRYADGNIGDMDLTLIDTAGYEDVTDESLESRMREQTEAAIEDADLILFMMDAREGVTSLDQIFADRLRPQHKPVILLANKSESRESGGGIGSNSSSGRSGSRVSLLAILCSSSVNSGGTNVRKLRPSLRSASTV